MDRIGARLVAEGLIDQEQLEAALVRQRRDGGYLGQHLIDGGFVERRAFYEALSRHWSLLQRDLVADPPRPEVLDQVAPEDSIERGWVACEVGRDDVVVATAVRPAPELVTEIEDHFPGRTIEFVACTRRDLDAVAVGLMRRRSSEHPASRRDLQPTTRRIHHLLAGLVVAVLLGLAALLPVDLAALIVLAGGALFLVGVSIQVILGLASFSRELDAGAAAGPSPLALAAARSAKDLPLYSVLVRLDRGAGAPPRALALLEGLDYPRARLDVLWLVDDDDAEALAEIGRLAPPECVRIVRLDPGAAVTADFDHGLALARGRYVVAYRDTDRPAADQLHLAVASFEHAVAERLAGRGWQPLMALRVHLRGPGGRRSAYERLAAVDFALRLDRSAHEVCTALVGREPFSTHFSMRLLRRAGGFHVATRPPVWNATPRDLPRVEELDSVTTVEHALTAREWVLEREQSVMVSITGWFARLLGAVRSPQIDRDSAWDAVRAASLPLMFLPLVPLLACAALIGLRSALSPTMIAEGVAWLVIGETILMIGSVTMFTSVVLAWRRGTYAIADLVLFPIYWAAVSMMFWAVSVALLGRYRLEGRRARARHRIAVANARDARRREARREHVPLSGSTV